MKGGFQILLNRSMLNNIQKLSHKRVKKQDDCIICTLYYLGISNIKDLIKIVEKNDEGIDNDIFLNTIIEHINYLKNFKREKILYDETSGRNITLDDLKYDEYDLFDDKEFNNRDDFVNFIYGNDKDIANKKFIKIKNGIKVNIYDHLYRKWCNKTLRKIFSKIHPGYATFLTIVYRDKEEVEEEDEEEEFNIPPIIGQYGYYSYYANQMGSEIFKIINSDNEEKTIHYSMKENIDDDDDEITNEGQIVDITEVLSYTNLPKYSWDQTEDMEHVLIIFKDLNNNVYFIDNQTGELYKGFKEIYEEYIRDLGVYFFELINTNIYLSSVDNPNKTLPYHSAIHHYSFDVAKQKIKKINTLEDLDLEIKSLQEFIKNEKNNTKIKKIIKKIKQLQELRNISINPKPNKTLVYSR
jgi:hypothetical protein